MISYDASSLDSNRTLLQEFHRIEDYLKANPVYKCYALQDDYVVGTSQYELADLVASESELAEGDVVIFANAYYGFVSSVGEEYFSVINVASVKGPQGSQGPQGPQGPAGADGDTGAIALVYRNVNEVANFSPTLVAPYQFNLDRFNRTPVLDDIFMGIIKDLTSGNTYVGMFRVSLIGDSTVNGALQPKAVQINGVDGVDGSAGPSALCYDRNIAFTRSADAQQLISVTLPFANFNRTPELNQDFVGILEDSGVCYVAQCEVQTISGTNVTSIVASDINKITGTDGVDGQDGTDGTNGKEALTTVQILTTGVEPAINQVKTLSASYFNRTPDTNEICPIIIVYNSTRTYQAIIQVVSVSNYQCQILNVVEISGTNGTNGTDALTYNDVYQNNYDTSITDYQALSLTKFNRTPILDEHLIYVYKNTTNGKSWLLEGQITNVGPVYASVMVVGLAETTGSSGTTLNKYTYEVTTQNSVSTTVYGNIYKVVTGAKGNVIIGIVDGSNNVRYSFVNQRSSGAIDLSCIQKVYNSQTSSTDFLFNGVTILSDTGSTVNMGRLIIGQNGITTDTTNFLTYCTITITYYNDTQLHS